MAKQARREMRRAMGIGALDTIQQQDQAVAMLSSALADTQRDMTVLESHLGRCVDQLAEGNNLVLRRATEYSEPLRRPFLGRLRWLFTGQ